MNQKRRNQVKDIQQELERLSTMLDDIIDEEQEAYDNLPEPFQDGERGEKMSSAISTMEDARGQIDDAASTLEDIFED